MGYNKSGSPGALIHLSLFLLEVTLLCTRNIYLEVSMEVLNNFKHLLIFGCFLRQLYNLKKKFQSVLIRYMFIMSARRFIRYQTNKVPWYTACIYTGCLRNIFNRKARHLISIYKPIFSQFVTHFYL